MSSSASTNKGKSKMEGDRKRREKDLIAPSIIQDKEDIFMKLDELLIWGISNQVTLEHITTRLPWSIFPILKSVSPTWQQAIKSHLILDARVRNHSTETVVVINHIQSDDKDCLESYRTNTISLYILRDKAFYHLPPIPQVHGGIPLKCHGISLDRKIYILGGTKDGTDQLGSREMYLFDLEQEVWKECAPMKEGRLDFGCGVLNGKIYVFGGTSLGKVVHGSEAYDPLIDAWSAIRRKKDVRFNEDVTAVGEELYVYSGEWDDPRGVHKANGLKAYHPGHNKWRTLSRNLLQGHEDDLITRLFMAEGKVHSISRSHIHVYDIENKSWAKLHSFSFAEIGQQHTKMGERSGVVRVHAVLHVENELLAMLSLYRRRTGAYIIGGPPNYILIPILVQSRGFNSQERKLVWEEVPCPLSSQDKSYPWFEDRMPSLFMCLLQL